MFFNKRRSPTLVNLCDFNTLYVRERNANLNTKTYLSSKSPISPLSGHNLRLVVTNGIPSNILILPKTSSSSTQKSDLQREKKSPKQTGYDVYRSLARSSSFHSPNLERDIINDDISIITNSLQVDRLSPLSNTGYFRMNNLPKIPKQHNHSNENQNATNKIKTTSGRIHYHQSTPPEMFHRTTPTSQYYEEKEKMTKTTKNLSCMMPKNQTRKQLHVYMPAINC